MCVVFGYDLKSRGFYASVRENNWTVRACMAGTTRLSTASAGADGCGFLSLRGAAEQVRERQVER